MNPEDAISESREVQIPLQDATLQGTLGIPASPKGVVIFAHGSGSSRFSPRNRYVAEVLRRAGLGTLLFDLLTADEERVDTQTAHLRFDIELLADRLVGATDWLGGEALGQGLPIGYFGASTGAAAALFAAARRAGRVAAVVSRGGRPDLARPVLGAIEIPTLLIVGERDTPVIGMNEDARDRMSRAEVRLEIVPGASHLFEEPGTLQEAAGLARDWFLRHFEDRSGAVSAPRAF